MILSHLNDTLKDWYDFLNWLASSKKKATFVFLISLTKHVCDNFLKTVDMLCKHVLLGWMCHPIGDVEIDSSWYIFCFIPDFLYPSSCSSSVRYGVVSWFVCWDCWKSWRKSFKTFGPALDVGWERSVNLCKALGGGKTHVRMCVYVCVGGKSFSSQSTESNVSRY